MQVYANLVLALEQMRVRALRAFHGSPPSSEEGPDPDPDPQPPRVLVLGPANSGKTTLSKMLINYAVRMGQSWNPVLVNVDPGEVCQRSHTYSAPFFLPSESSGWLGSTRCNLCRNHYVTNTDIYTGINIWLGRYIRSCTSHLQCPPSLSILVWPRGNSAQPTPDGPADT